MNKRKKHTSTTELYAGGPTFPSDLRAAVLGRVPLNTSHIRQPSPHMSEALEINQTKLAVVKERERKKKKEKKTQTLDLKGTGLRLKRQQLLNPNPRSNLLLCLLGPWI